MTTNPKAARFFVRRVERPSVPPEVGPDLGFAGLPFDTQDDGFGTMDFRRPAGSDAGAAGTATQGPQDDAEDDDLASIAAEGLTGRQLRRARAVSQKHGIEAKSDLDAVLQLRRIGLDPFSRASLLEVVTASADQTRPHNEPGNEQATQP